MFSRKFPVYYFAICIAVTFLVSYLIFGRAGAETKKTEPDTAAPDGTAKSDRECQYDITRLKGYPHVSPIVSAAQECEAETLMPLKLSVSGYIDQEKQVGNLIGAAVYMRRLNNDDWMNVNPEEVFHPASLLKVPQLITFLKMAETVPGLLEREYLFKKPDDQLPKQYYSAKTLQPGHKYTIKELFHFMIVYSDNYANIELVTRMDLNVFNKTFRDLGLKPPDLTDQNYKISPKDYSKFLEVLYNAAYLNIPASEYASELLAEAHFKDGILKKIPKTIPVAHKMGEWGDGQTVELHDCGIVYLDRNPYIITIMTRGTDMDKLSETIGNISRMVYEAMLSNPR